MRAVVRVRVLGVRGDLMAGAMGAAAGEDLGAASGSAAEAQSSSRSWAQGLVRGAPGGSPQAQVEVSLRGIGGRLGVPQRTRAFNFKTCATSATGQEVPSAVGDWVRSCVRVCDLAEDSADDSAEDPAEDPAMARHGHKKKQTDGNLNALIFLIALIIFFIVKT